MPKKNNPGCNCCETCTILTDDFARASIGSDWTQASGSWSIASSVLIPPAFGVLLTVPTSSANVDRTAAVDAVTLTSGDIIRLLLCAADASNYMAAEFEPDGIGAGQDALRVINRSSGSDTVVETVNVGNIDLSSVTLRACWSDADNLFGVRLTDSGGTHHGTWVSGTDHGSKAGLYTSGVTAGIGFDNFSFDECSEGDCLTTGCTLCTRTQVVKVVISSLGNGVCTTGHPTGTYLLPAGDRIGGSSATCVFSKTFDAVMGNYQDGTCICASTSGATDHLSLRVELDSGSESVEVIHADGASFVTYNYNVDSMTGFCSNSSLSTTYNSAAGGFCVGAASHAYDWPNATIALERVL